MNTIKQFFQRHSSSISRHSVFTTTVAAFLLAVGLQTAKANPVEPAKASKTAATFLSSNGAKTNADDLTDITAATPFNNIYIFSINNGKGFIVISADDRTTPVLAYSLNNPFVASDMPQHVKAWYESYERKIDKNRKAPENKTVRAEWERLANGIGEPAPKAIVGPFISTKWNQSPRYNLYCPYDSANHGRAVAGCTAIATAQIMKYFNHPERGYGNCTYTHPSLGEISANYDVEYLWDSMPETLNKNSSEAEIDAVATVVYHVGVAVSMDYSYKGSGGKTASYGYGGEPSSENAFKYNFKYSPYVWTAFRIDYTLSEWKALIKNELDNGRPILYAGYDEVQSGHAFVCDGYKESPNGATTVYHFNWGWGGTYDGYYQLDNLNPNSFQYGNSGYHFDLFATATMGIEPYDGWDETGTTTVTATSEGIRGASDNDGSVTGAGNYNFGDTITLIATANNEQSKFVQWSDGCRYNPRVTVATGGNISFTAQFAPVNNDTVRYHTCDNAMNRASNLPLGLGVDSIWGIKIPASALKAGARLNAVRFMGRKQALHTLSIYTGTDTPEQNVYTASFVDSLDYDYTFHTHHLSAPVDIDGTKALWIKLKCTEIDTPGVFSIYGGNPNSMLVGDNLTSMGDQWRFSWMIEGLFSGNVGIDDVCPDKTEISIYPNPASTSITIQGISNLDKVEIIDMNGTVQTAYAHHGTIDISGLNPGVYLLRMANSERLITKRFVVGTKR